MIRILVLMMTLVFAVAGCAPKDIQHLSVQKAEALEAYADCVLRNLSAGRLVEDRTAGPGQYALDVRGIGCQEPFPDSRKVIAKIVGKPSAVDGLYLRIHGWGDMISVLILYWPGDPPEMTGYKFEKVTDRSLLVRRISH
jgi:hypothetical protein